MTLQQWVLRPRSRVGRLAWVVSGVAVATFVRWLFTPIVGGKIPWMMFACATLVSAVIGGRGPGLLAAALGGFAGTVLSIANDGGWHPIMRADVVSLAAYLAAATIIVMVGNAVRSAFVDLDAERARL